MHCPRCGQEQVSEDIKFCSRCGFPLGLVSEILEHGGFLPQLADIHKAESKPKITKKHGVAISLLWLLFFIFLTAFFGIIGAGRVTGLWAIIGVFGSLMIFIGSLILLKSAPRQLPMSVNDMQQPNVHGIRGVRQHHNALPPQRVQPVDTYMPPQPGGWRAPDTGELVNPGSVTDGTTKLLEKDR